MGNQATNPLSVPSFLLPKLWARLRKNLSKAASGVFQAASHQSKTLLVGGEEQEAKGNKLGPGEVLKLLGGAGRSSSGHPSASLDTPQIDEEPFRLAAKTNLMF